MLIGLVRVAVAFSMPPLMQKGSVTVTQDMLDRRELVSNVKRGLMLQWERRAALHVPLGLMQRREHRAAPLVLKGLILM